MVAILKKNKVSMHLFGGHLDLLLEKEKLGIHKKDIAAPLCAVYPANDRRIRKIFLQIFSVMFRRQEPSYRQYTCSVEQRLAAHNYW